MLLTNVSCPPAGWNPDFDGFCEVDWYGRLSLDARLRFSGYADDRVRERERLYYRRRKIRLHYPGKFFELLETLPPPLSNPGLRTGTACR